MREPFYRLLGRGERLLAAGEVDLARRTGPLAMPAEMLALFSPIVSLVLLVRLDGLVPKLLGALLAPLLIIFLARYPLRRWRRPREWIGVTDRRVLRWRRPAALFGSPRIEAVPLPGLEGVELDQDDWDRRTGTAQVIAHLQGGETRSLGRLHNAARIRDALVGLPAATPAGPQEGWYGFSAEPPLPRPGDYRPDRQ